MSDIIAFYDKTGEYGCFSQFYLSSFVGDISIKDTFLDDKTFNDYVKGVKFSCREQWMMLHKALLFKDYDNVDNIMQTNVPSKIKSFGRKVKNYNDVEWNQVCYDVVVNGNYLQFSQNQKMKELLLSTQDKLIVEASPTDKKWRIGIDKKMIKHYNPDNFPGQNLLGKAIMEVRLELLK